MASSPLLTCNRCGAPIQSEELVQGLAVRVDGEMVCSMCVDSLPGEAQIQINQMRAIKGLSATTYQVVRASAPRLQLFTFTTVGNVTQHRRKLVADGFYEAPALPPPSERAIPPTLQTSAPRERAQRGQPAPGGKRLVIAVAATVIVLGGGALALSLVAAHHASATPASANLGTPPPARPEPPKPAKTRFDYSVDPLQGWIQASQDRDCPDFVRLAITQELQLKRSQQLDQAEQALADQRLDDATRLANALSVPDDISFRDLGLREQRLRKQLLDSRTLATIKPPPAPVTAPASTPVAAVPAVPAVASTDPPAAHAPPAPATPEPEPAGTKPAIAAGDRPCWMINGEELLAGHESPDWTHDNARLALLGDAASLRRGLHLAAGHYQLWLRVQNPNRESSLQLSLGGLKAKALDFKPSDKPLWLRAFNEQGGNTFAIAGEAPPLDLIATGKGMEIIKVYIADAELPGPAIAVTQNLSRPLPEVGVAPAAPVAAGDAPGVAIWKPAFNQGPRELPIHPLPVDGSAVLPPSWPGGCDGFYRSAKAVARKHHVMVLDLSKNIATKGGVALLLHPMRVDRKQLQISLVDANGKAVALPPLQFADNEWTPFVIPLPPASELAQLATLSLEDEPGLDFVADDAGFLLAKAAVCTNQPPRAEMLEVRPAALVRDDQRLKTLPRLVEALGRFRKRSWAKTLDPAKLRVLAPPAFPQEWRLAVRQHLEPLLPGKLPATLFQELSFQDSWLDTMFKNPGGGQAAAVDAQAHHVVMLCTGGVELAGGASAAQALDTFWKKRLEQLINAGILPVVVIGPDHVPDDRRAEADKLWNDLSDFIAKRLAGVPIIDLRSARGVAGGELGPAGSAYTAELVADGYAEFVYWLRRSLGAR